MSYDLIVHVNELNDSIVPEWLEELRRFNMSVEIHPAFTFESQSGFLPFKIIVFDCPNPKLNEMELMSGFELSVNDLYPEVKRSIWSKWFSKDRGTHSGTHNYTKELVFRISIQDSFEYRLAWYSAAAIVKMCNGILIDPQENIQLAGNQAIRHAYEQVINDEKSIQEDEWRIHKFNGWIA